MTPYLIYLAFLQLAWMDPTLSLDTKCEVAVALHEIDIDKALVDTKDMVDMDLCF